MMQEEPNGKMNERGDTGDSSNGKINERGDTSDS